MTARQGESESNDAGIHGYWTILWGKRRFAVMPSLIIAGFFVPAIPPGLSFITLDEAKGSMMDWLLAIVIMVLMVGVFLLPVVTLFWVNTQVNTERAISSFLVKWLVSLTMVLGCLGALEMVLACVGLWHQVFDESLRSYQLHSYSFFEEWSTGITSVAINTHGMIGLRLMLSIILLCSLFLALLVQWWTARDKKLWEYPAS